MFLFFVMLAVSAVFVGSLALAKLAWGLAAWWSYPAAVAAGTGLFWCAMQVRKVWKTYL